MTRLRSVATRLASSSLLAYGILILLTLWMGHHATEGVRNPDTFLHLRLGYEFTHGWAPWDTGHLTIFDSKDWYPTQWLSQVLFYGVYSQWGLQGMVQLATLMFVGLASAVFFSLRPMGSPLLAALATGGVLWGTEFWLSLRPQVFSFMLMAALLFLWWRSARSGRPPWLLLPLFLAWPLIHGMWLVGLAASLFLAAALLLRDGWAARRATLFVTLGGLALTLITPLHWGLWEAALAVGSRAGYFTEWGPASYTDPHNFVVLLMGMAAAALLSLSPRRDLFSVAVLLLGIGLAVYSHRTVPLAAIAFATLIVEYGSAHLPRQEKTTVARLAPISVAAVAGVFFVLATLTPPGFSTQSPAISDVLNDLSPGTVVLTDYANGSQLLFTRPQLQVLPHGYADAYTDDELDRYGAMTDLLPDWEAEVKKTGAEYALGPEEDPFTYALEGQGWQVVARDSTYVLLRRA